MLVLSRKIGERETGEDHILIEGEGFSIDIYVMTSRHSNKGSVGVGIIAPKSLNIVRGELLKNTDGNDAA